MNSGDTVKLQPPVATTVYANVPVDTAMIATNLYGPSAPMTAPAATHIPLIATAGPQPPHPQTIQMTPAQAQHQQIITHTHPHTPAPSHANQATLQSVQAAAAVGTVAASQNNHSMQPHPSQAHLQFAHQSQLQAAGTGGSAGTAVTTPTIDNTEYAVMNGRITQDGTVVCYSPEEMPVAGTITNLVAVEQMAGATGGHTAHHIPHHVIMTNGPSQQTQSPVAVAIALAGGKHQPALQQQHQHQTVTLTSQHVSNSSTNNANNNNSANNSNINANNNNNNSNSNNSNNNNTNNNVVSAAAPGSHNNADNGNEIPLDQLKQMLATQLEYYFSRYAFCFMC